MSRRIRFAGSVAINQRRRPPLAAARVLCYTVDMTKAEQVRDNKKNGLCRDCGQQPPHKTNARCLECLNRHSLTRQLNRKAKLSRLAKAVSDAGAEVKAMGYSPLGVGLVESPGKEYDLIHVIGIDNLGRPTTGCRVTLEGLPGHQAKGLKSLMRPSTEYRLCAFCPLGDYTEK